MSWQPEVEELNRRAAMAREMGGAESVAFHRGRGKLTVRDRIAALADEGTFDEFGVLAGTPEWDGNRLTKLTPLNGVAGTMRLEGRKVVVHGGDFTIRGGAPESPDDVKHDWAVDRALRERMPFVRLLDSAGGSVRSFEKLGRTYLPTVNLVPEIELMQVVPCVSAVLGSVAGLPAVQAVFSHFNVMVASTAQLFVAGPPVVKAAHGLEMSKEDLGGEAVHVVQSGVVANLAATELDALQQVRTFLSYLPANVWEMPPRVEPIPALDGNGDTLLDFIPRNPRRSYDPFKLLSAVVDAGSLFEIQPLFGRSRVTALARVNGYPVGVMMNDPRFGGGSLDAAAAQKTSRLVQLCDTFHLPLIYFGDEPGMMVGPESERAGLIRSGARTWAALTLSRMPYLSFIIRQAYGVAGALHFRGGSAMYRRYAWPSGKWGSMHIEGGVSAAYRREIEAAPDPEAKRIEIEARLAEIASPFRTAHAMGVEIIDPRRTRALMVDFVEDAQARIKGQLGPTSRVPALP